MEASEKGGVRSVKVRERRKQERRELKVTKTLRGGMDGRGKPWDEGV